MFAKFSPDATRAAYVRANDLYVERLSDGRITRLTSTGSETIINGTSDWVYEEELDVRDGFRWSPDGRRIAYWQFDTSGVGIFTLLNNTDSVYPVATRIPYPKPGTTNSAARIGVIAADGGDTTWMQTPGDPRDSYLARLEWQDNGALAIQQLNRLQNQQDLLSADARTGQVARVFRDRSETLGRRRRHGALGGQGQGLPLAQRARRLAARLQGRHRRHVDGAGHDLRRRRDAAARRRRRRRVGLLSSPRPTTRRPATCIAPAPTAGARRNA